jgi:hypothetical protein
MKPIYRLCLAAGALAAFASAGGIAAAPGAGELYATRVQPLLARRCYACHSEAAGKSGALKAGLRLDSAESWLRGGTSGPAVVPGKPEESLLLRVVRRSPGVPAMPPGAPLTSSEIALLESWIRQGAPTAVGSRQSAVGRWQSAVGSRQKSGAPAQHPTPNTQHPIHWSLRTLRTPSVPPIRDPQAAIRNREVRNPIDAFVLARLQARGLRPRTEADRRTLIRRATYDLTGLPPSPGEVDAFVADRRPDAYARLIDRLLASPRYGERWGRHWLDVAHYGDTHGYDKDKRRPNAWPYRDYVIRAFNTDKPYARFLREQIAGDVLFPESPEAVAATGFVAAGPWDFVGHVELAEGTVEKAKTRLLDRDDMVASAISTFNSVTIHCARCHDHKFDPIPQRDYYRLQAVFAGIDRGDRPYGDPAVLRERAELTRREGELQQRLKSLQAQIAAVSSPELARLDGELAGLRAELAKLPMPAGAASPSNGYHSGIEARADVEKWVQVDLGRAVPIDEIRLLPARPTDFPDTPGFGFPSRFRVTVSEEPAFTRAVPLVDHTGGDFPNPAGAAVTVPGGGKRARYVRVTATRLWPRTHDFVFALGELQVISAGRNAAAGAAVTSLDSIEAGRWSTRYLVDGFDSRAALPAPGAAADPAQARREELQRRIAERERGRIRLAESLVPAPLRQERESAAAEALSIAARLRALPALPGVFALVTHAPRPIRVLARGEVEQPREEVTPGGLSCIPGLSPDFSVAPGADEGARRAALADWLASPRNPLTWRSIVNRVWHYHFGRGIVDTPNDFGRNGSAPTHPELLDWLARWFLTSGGSLKKLHRLIMTSAAYRRSSSYDPASARIDSDNRFLWRMNRRRLEAEAVRDSVLAAGGKLDLTMGGPPFELFRFKDDHSPTYDFTAPERVRDPATWRRTVYAFTVRSVPNPFLECLDCADPNLNTPSRNTTLTSLQALALLNDPFMLQQSELLAERIGARETDPSRQVDLAFRLLFGRRTRPEEKSALVGYVRQHGLPAACRLLYNTNEFLFVD